MPLRITAGVASDTGRVRAVNEDAWCLMPRLYAVADGMGGHAAGDRASWLAVDALRRVGEAGSFDASDIQRSLQEANAEMVAEAGALRQDRTMGTTVVGVGIVRFAGTDHWLTFNVGDSRAYQFENGVLQQISVDHSEVQELIDAGRILPEEAASHPRRNVVTRSLGTPDVEAADTWLLPMAAGQTMLLCSDGLTLEVAEPEIAAVLARSASPGDLARTLVEAAVDAGGRDNVTVLVIRADEADEASADDQGEDFDGEDTTPRAQIAPEVPFPLPAGGTDD